MSEGRIRLVDLFEIDAKPLRQPKDRIVYAYTFPEQNLAYIGLTGDERKRMSSHKSLKAQKTTAVSRYIRETGLEPQYEIISKTEDNPSGWVDEDRAAELECYFMEKYKAKGWDLLNLAPCGSKGGSIKDEYTIINSLDNFIHSTDTSLETFSLLPGSDYTVAAIENYNLRDQVFNRIKNIVKANNITSAKQLRALAKRRASKLIEDWTAKHPEDSWQKKLFPETTSGREKPKESVEAFLKDPNNLDKDQLKLLTKRAWRQVGDSQEKAFLMKLKGILDRYNVTSPKGIGDLTGSSTIAWMLSDHDKNNRDNAWKDKLFPKGYVGKGSGAKVKTQVKESAINKEIFERLIKSCCSK